MAIFRAYIDNGSLRRQPPSDLRRYYNISKEEWLRLSDDIYEALLPALAFQRFVMLSLFVFWVLPFLAFMFFLTVVFTGSAKTLDDEEAFGKLLVIGLSAIVGVGIGCLLVGSILRCLCVDSFLGASLAAVACEFEDRRDRLGDFGDDGENMSIDIRLKPVNILRRALLSWYDVDYVVLVSTRGELEKERIAESSFSFDYTRMFEK